MRNARLIRITAPSHRSAPNAVEYRQVCSATQQWSPNISYWALSFDPGTPYIAVEDADLIAPTQTSACY